MIRSTLSALMFSMVFAACSSSSDSGTTNQDGGGGATGGAGQDGGATDAGGGAAFPAVLQILQTSCVRCHDPAHPFVPEAQTYVAMDLTTNGAYAALVNKNATETCGGKLVTPGDPSKSYLYAKVSEDTPCDGERMPHSGMVLTPPLADADIATIESWIRGGAKR